MGPPNSPPTASQRRNVSNNRAIIAITQKSVTENANLNKEEKHTFNG